MIFFKENKLFNILGNIIIFFVSLFLLFVILGFFSISVNTLNINIFLKIPLVIVGFAIMAALLILISKPIIWLANKLSNKQYIIFLIVLTLVTRIIWVFLIKSPITSDFKIMYETAIKLISGDYTSIDKSYFNLWVYQFGFSGYEALVMSIFHTTSPLIIKLLNIFYCLGTTLLVYKIGSKIFNETSGRVSGFFYSIYISSLVMTSALTNEHIATFLFLLGIYVFLCSNLSFPVRAIILGVLVALGNINRPLGSLVLLAIIIYLILKLVKEFNFVNIKRTCASLILIIISYIVIMNLASYIFIAKGITPYKLTNRDPFWKFVTGLNYDTKGQYSEKDDSYLYGIKDPEERKKLEIPLIKERVSNVPKLASLIKDKVLIMWSGPDDSTYWTCQYLNKRILNIGIIGTERIEFIAMAFYSIIAALFLFKEKKYNKNLLILLLIAGYASVHFFIEIQTRYKYFMIPLLAIVQGYGVYISSKYLKR